MSSPELIFLHIPKTAGTSQQGAFNEYYGNQNYFWIGKDCPTTVRRYPHKLVGERLIVGGHRPLSFYPRSFDPLYCAILRDPIERAISLFAYYTRPDFAASERDREIRVEQLDRWLAKGIDPDSMLDSIRNCRPFRREITNAQCRYLSRGGATFAGVLESLKDLDVMIGTVKQHAEFRRELWDLLDWAERAPTRVNRGQDNYAATFMQDQELVAQIAELNKEDQSLYDHVDTEHKGLWRQLRDETHRRRRLRALPVALGKRKSRHWHWEDAPDLWPRRESTPLKWPLDRMMMAEPYRLLYMPIPGAADADLQRTMLELSDATYPDAILGIGIDRVVQQFATGLMLVDRSPDEISAIALRDDFFKFAIVYEPFTRLVDIYHQRFVEKRTLLAQWPRLYQLVAAAQEQAEADLDTGVSFRQFCLAVTGEHIKHKLWLPQVRYLQWAETYSRLYVPGQLHALEAELAARTGKSIRVRNAELPAAATVASPVTAMEASGCYADTPAGELPGDPQQWRDQLLDDALRDAIKDYYSWDFKLYNRLAQQDLEEAPK